MFVLLGTGNTVTSTEMLKLFPSISKK